MNKEIEAVYEQGVIRPLQPLELPEGARLDLIVITHEQPKAKWECGRNPCRNCSSTSKRAQLTTLPAAITIRFYIRKNSLLNHP